MNNQPSFRVAMIPPTDPRLSTLCKRVENIAEQVTPLLPAMFDLARKLKFAVGLAAPQIGFSLRFFIYRNVAWSVVINPIVLHRSDEMVAKREGCLSWPGKFKVVPRPSAIVVRWQDERGVLYEQPVTALRAAIFQHEIDHLNGHCIFGHDSRRD